MHVIYIHVCGYMLNNPFHDINFSLKYVINLKGKGEYIKGGTDN